MPGGINIRIDAEGATRALREGIAHLTHPKPMFEAIGLAIGGRDLFAKEVTIPARP